MAGGGLITASALFGALVVAGAVGLTWIVGEGETTRKGAGGVGCAKAGRLGESHTHIQTRPSHSGPKPPTA